LNLVVVVVAQSLEDPKLSLEAAPRLSLNLAVVVVG
jgi:hypothetical protein